MNYQNYPGNIIDADYVEVSPAPYSMDIGLLPWRASAGSHQHGPAESGAIPGDCRCLCTANSRESSEVVRCLYMSL